MPQIAPKEERRVLGYASDGLRGKVRWLGKPPGQVNLKLIQETHIACHERSEVGQVVAQGRDALGANAKGEAVYFSGRCRS